MKRKPRYERLKKDYIYKVTFDFVTIGRKASFDIKDIKRVKELLNEFKDRNLGIVKISYTKKEDKHDKKTN